MKIYGVIAENSREPRLGPQEGESQDDGLRQFLYGIEANSKSRRLAHLAAIEKNPKPHHVGETDPYIFPRRPESYDLWKPRVEQRVRGKLKEKAKAAALSPRTYIASALMVYPGQAEHFSEFFKTGQYSWLPVNHGVSPLPS